MIRSLLLCLLLALPRPAAAEALVAVATNFLSTARALGAAFEAEGGEPVTLVAGSTGKLAAQIVAGAPFDAFLAADAVRPAALEAEGVATGRFPYALGRLALVAPPPAPAPPLDALRSAERIAIANPALAPYGVAAMQVLDALGVAAPALARAENVSQALALVATGNAPLGLVALADAQAAGLAFTPVPDTLHAPIRQEAVLVARARRNGTAARFLTFLGRPEARVIIARAGYGLPAER